MAVPERFPLDVNKVLHWMRLGLPPREEMARLEEEVPITRFYNTLDFWGHRLAEHYPESGLDEYGYLDDVARPLGTYIYDFYATEMTHPYPAVDLELRRLVRISRYRASIKGAEVRWVSKERSIWSSFDALMTITY